jgi:hypothetical protein
MMFKLERVEVAFDSEQKGFWAFAGCRVLPRHLLGQAFYSCEC